MTVYKYFIRIALKNKWTILIYTLLFLLLSIINGANTSNMVEDFIDSKSNIGIIDKDNSELSKGLKGYLGGKNRLVNISDDMEDIKEQIFLEVIDAVVVIPEDFHENLINKEKAVQVFSDDRKMETIQVQQQINKFLVFVGASMEDGEYDLNLVNTALGEKASISLLRSDEQVNKGAETWFKYYYNFTSYVIIAIYIAVIGIVMNDFSDENIESRMKISSKKFLQFNKELYLGQLTVAATITLIFILGSVILKGKHIGEVDFSKYLVNLIVFSFTILCLTFLINNSTNNRFIKNGLSTVLSLGTSFISGVMVPQEFLGDSVLKIAKFFPTYYYVRINEMRITSFSDIRYEIFMQLLFSLAFILMGLYFSRVKQRA